MAHPAFYSNENLYTKEEYNKHIENGYLTDEDGQGHWVVNGTKQNSVKEENKIATHVLWRWNSEY